MNELLDLILKRDCASGAKPPHNDAKRYAQNTTARMYLLESCVGRVNPRGLRVPAFAGRVRVELAAGRARDEKFFVRVAEC